METIKSQEFGSELEFATKLAEEAGDITLSQFGLTTEVVWKEDNSPLTEADTAINRLVIERVTSTYPSDGVLGEEASRESGRERLWVVDPIDGTQPFSLGVPISTFCIALVVNKEPVLGVVYDPFQQRMYQAVKGEGAFVNGVRLHVSEATSLQQNYVVVSSRMSGNYATTGEFCDRFAQARGKSFNFRSIAYSCMMVASGKAVEVVAGYFHPWDVAAVKVILEEAGAKVTDFNDRPLLYERTDGGLIVSNGLVHNELSHLVRQA